MPLRIDLNPKVEVQTSIGPVFIYETAADAINKYARQPDSGPLSKVRQFLELAATTRTRERASEHIPLSEAEAKSLTDDDIERVAEGYLKMPNSLYYIAEGRKATSPMIRGNEEYAVTFLDRLLIFRAKHEREYIQRFAKIGDPTRKLIEQTFGKSASILRELSEDALGLSAVAAEARRQQSALDAFRELDQVQKLAAVPSAGVTFEEPPGVKIMRRAEERRRQEHKEVLDLARSTSEMTVRSAEHLAQLSQTTTTMLGQFGDFLGRFAEASKRSDKGSRIAIWLAACSLLVSAVLASMSYFQDARNNLSTDQWQAEVSRDLKKQTDLADQSLRALSEENAKLRDRVEALEKGSATKDPRRSGK